MKSYATENIRNVVLVGHGGSGKTSLAEAFLFRSGATTRMGKIAEGNTVCDFDEEEIRKQISISTALAPFEWDGHKINLLDAPGYADFIGDLSAAMRVADLAIFVVSAVEGLEVQTEVAWRYADELNLPRIVLVNKVDRENSSFRRTLDQMRETFGMGIAPISLPLGREHDFKGVISVIDVAAFEYDEHGHAKEVDIPAERQERVDEVRTALLDSVAETNDELLARYLEGGELTRDEIVSSLHDGLSSASVYPVVVGAATKLIGIDRLADIIVAAGPSPLDRPPVETDNGAREAKPDAPLAALVFKTMTDPYVGRVSYFRVYSGTLKGDAPLYNATHKTEERVGHVFTMRGKTQDPLTEVVAGDIGAVAKLAHTSTGDTISDKGEPVVLPVIEAPEPLLPKAIQPKTKGDEDKLMIGLHKIIEEDTSLRLERNDETHQTILWGMGDAHLDVVLERLKRKFSVEVEEVPFIVPYRSTLKSKAEALGRHVKQSGGHGQYGVCNIRVEPLPRGGGFVFEDKIFGGSIPSQWVASVEKGIVAAMERGVGTGYPMIDLKVELYDGKFHSVDSSDMAFQLAGSAGMKDAIDKAGVTLLEPVWSLDVMVPEEFTGDIMGDLQKRRGIPEGIDTVGTGRQIVKAKVPFAEVTHYATDLRSMTGGKGTFSWAFSHYQEVPHELTQKILATTAERARALSDDEGSLGALLGETRARIVGLLEGLDYSTAERPVPACPAWSVKDLAGHLSGTYVDASTGNLEGTGTDPWTAAQVAARREWKLGDILAEWNSASEMVEPALDAMAAGGMKAPAMQLIADVTTHEHDLRGALDAPGARDSEGVRVGLRYFISGLRRNLEASGAPALCVRATDFREWTAGRTEPAATWSGTSFDLFRTLSGRRTKDQALAMGWDGDPAPFVGHLLAAELFTWPEAEIPGG